MYQPCPYQPIKHAGSFFNARNPRRALEALMKGTAINTLLLEDSEAAIERVKMEMKSHSWVHFACHGIQDVHQPLETETHFETIEPFVKEIKECFPSMGARQLVTSLRQDYNLKVPEYVVCLLLSKLGYIFSEGNIPETFKSFETNHMCNNFCQMFGLLSDYEDCVVAT
ncbi:hypothetical protein BYT27DRAFT_7197653 [Phlegmacium glaucopus]|nr:hypothetical protein BYT27DRAFT_7197653 [Phlegmacium glaucopus]